MVQKEEEEEEGKEPGNTVNMDNSSEVIYSMNHIMCPVFIMVGLWKLNTRHNIWDTKTFYDINTF